MQIENKETKIFCELLLEVYKDNYIEPSNEWTSLSGEDLELEFERFKKKKCQSEKVRVRDSDRKKEFHPLHFSCDPRVHFEPVDEAKFQDMSKFLDTSVIRNGKELKEAFLALRWMLEENGCYIPRAIQEKLKKVGISIDSARVFQPEKKHIVIQAIAQVIAHHIGNFNIKKIKSIILNFRSNFGKLLYLDQWKSVRNYDESLDGFESKDRAQAIERVISSVNPIPIGQRRGRPPSHTPGLSKAIIYIPGIFNELDGISNINFQKLRIAIAYLAWCLVLSVDLHDGITDRSITDAIIGHPIILKYSDRVPIFLQGLLEHWIINALDIAVKIGGPLV